MKPDYTYTDADRREIQIANYGEFKDDAEFDAPRKPLGIIGGIILAAVFAVYVWGLCSGWMYVKGWL